MWKRFFKITFKLKSLLQTVNKTKHRKLKNVQHERHQNPSKIPGTASGIIYSVLDVAVVLV